MDIDLKIIDKIYVIGIKGSGIIAIVELLHAMGKEISGSDVSEKFFTDEVLHKHGVKYFEHFSAENVPTDADLVIYSTAYNESNNVEMAQARKKNLPMASYPEVLGLLFNQKYGIAVCGTHGKTTTSAMLADALKEIGVSPTAVIGSRVKAWGGNALAGSGEYFVAETDEYQSKLSLYDPKAAIFTSCDWDHPDYFENFEAYKKTFRSFVERIPKTGFLAVWGDSTDTLEVAGGATCDVLTYGFSDDCDYQIFNFHFSFFDEFPMTNDQIFKPKQTFEVKYRDENLGIFEISLAGKHNVLNATAVIAMCHKLNLDMEKVKKALKKFQGTSRRFEYIGQRNGAILIDDYGHHPDEVKATLRAAREIYPEKKIWAVFHPHTFTRTKALLHEFSQSFSDVDKAIILDIYGSAREPHGGVHSSELVDLINKYDRDKAEYIPTISQAVNYLEDKIESNDVVITIGAGNVWEVADKLKQ